MAERGFWQTFSPSESLGHPEGPLGIPLDRCITMDTSLQNHWVIMSPRIHFEMCITSDSNIVRILESVPHDSLWQVHNKSSESLGQTGHLWDSLWYVHNKWHKCQNAWVCLLPQLLFDMHNKSSESLVQPAPPRIHFDRCIAWDTNVRILGSASPSFYLTDA